MAKPLDARIAAALSQDARAATVADLLTELTAQIDEAQADHDRQDEISKSATATEDEAEAAADQVGKLSRRIVRLAAKRDQLQTRHSELLASDRRKAATDRHTAAKARRDELVADLQRDVPGLFDKLVDYFERIQASDAECEGLGDPGYGLERLESAEALARGCGSHFRHEAGPIMRLTQIRLPQFDASKGGRNAWPVQHNPYAAVMEEQQSAAQRRLAEQQRTARETQNYLITPPNHPRFEVFVETQTRRLRVTSRPVTALMTPFQVEVARSVGLEVQPAPAGQTIGMPSSGEFLS